MSAFDLLETRLEEHGLSPEVRKAIRNAKICVIDDQLDHLESFLEGLRKEGFSNLTKLNQVTSVNDLLSSDYDLIVLDLSGVAKGVAEDDGIGVLGMLKRADPGLPVLVVTGSTTPPDLAHTLSLADAIRMKPIMPADLAADVEALLKIRKDMYWASLAILRELKRMRSEFAEKLGFWDKMKLRFYQYKLQKNLEDRAPGIVMRITKIAGILVNVGSLGIKIVSIANGLASK